MEKDTLKDLIVLFAPSILTIPIITTVSTHVIAPD